MSILHIALIVNMVQYLKPFNFVQPILVCEQISTNSFKNMITNKLLT